jgi:hypothetical protein
MSTTGTNFDSAAERVTIHRWRELPRDLTPSEIDHLLRELGATGKLTINYSQGGRCSITFEEQERI